MQSACQSVGGFLDGGEAEAEPGPVMAVRAVASEDN